MLRQSLLCLIALFFFENVRKVLGKIEEKLQQKIEQLLDFYVLSLDVDVNIWSLSMKLQQRKEHFHIGAAGCVCGKQELCFTENFIILAHLLSWIMSLSLLLWLHLSPPPLLPSLHKPLDLMNTVYITLLSLCISPSLSLLEVRSDTVPGRGAERRADVAVESRGDEPGPGAAVRRHL